MPSSLLYVSRCALPAAVRDEQLAAIQAVSLARNSELDLTGVLVSTPTYFAQFLEGEEAPLAQVTRSIRADPRHTDIFEAQTPAFDTLQFAAWRMMCFPPSSATSRFIHPVLEQHHGKVSASDAARLIDFLRQIAGRKSDRPGSG